jgi:phage/plasmid primase-like uncharacterized protein
MNPASFLNFALTQGVLIDPARLRGDGRIHRADVGEQPSGRGDAAYLLREDGTGWVTNFKTEGRPVYFRPELARELTPEEQVRAEADRQAWRAAQAVRQREAVQDSLARWEQAREPQSFPYLRQPVLDPAGLRQGRAQLLVPMLAIDESGEPSWVGMQRIAWAKAGASPNKRFVSGTPTRGAFAAIPINGADVEAPLRAYEAARGASKVAICEGVGTALAIHQATGLPVLVALSAQNLPDVARSVHALLNGQVLICADNDGERAAYKGQSYALRAARILGAGRTLIALPERPGGITPPGYDARDQFRDGGAQAVRDAMQHAMHAPEFEKRIPEQYRPRRASPRTETSIGQEQSADSALQRGVPRSQQEAVMEQTQTQGDGEADHAAGAQAQARMHELTLREFRERAEVIGLQNHGRRWEVRLGAEHAFSDAAKPQAAVDDVHRASVNNALFLNSPAHRIDGVQSTLPPPAVLVDYPDLIEKYQDAVALAPMGAAESNGHANVPGDSFAELNQAAEAAERDHPPTLAARKSDERVMPESKLETARSSEHTLLAAWRKSATPVQELRAKALHDLARTQQVEREKIVGGFDQVRADKAKELGEIDPERREQFVAFEIAKQLEQLHRRQNAERKALQGELPLVPTLRDFLEQRAGADVVAARMLEDEKLRAGVPDVIQGRRVARLEPAIFEGLTHELVDEPEKAIHYAHDGDRVMTDRGGRVDVYSMDDREIEAALRLAEQKYDMKKGLQLTGSREFQERAAEFAGRLGLKVQNTDLLQTWQLGRLQALQSVEFGEDARLAAPAHLVGGIEPAKEVQPPGSEGRHYPVDQKRMASEAILARMDLQAQNALDRADGLGVLAPGERTALMFGEKALIDEGDRLTPMGVQVRQHMREKIEGEREQLQQQLRTRNIDEEMEGRQQQEVAREDSVEIAREKKIERVQVPLEERSVEPPRQAPARARSRGREQGVGLG